METHIYVHHSIEFSWPLVVFLVLIVACIAYPMVIEYQTTWASAQQDAASDPRPPIGFHP